MDEVELPYKRAELIATLRGMGDADFQRRMWVEKQPSRYIESLDEDIQTLYDDSNVTADPFRYIGVILRNTREAAAMQALDRVLGPLYDALPYPVDHVALLAMPEWQEVVTAAQAVLAELLDNDTTLDGLEPWATTDPPVITVDVERHGVAVTDVDLPRAAFVGTGQVSAERRAARGPSDSARAVVEILSRFGGHPTRVLLGAGFHTEPADRTVFRVEFGADAGPNKTCLGRLCDRPLSVGLPEAYAQATLDGLAVDAFSWPPGTLRIDRAGFDEAETSARIFTQAATALAAVISAKLDGRDVEAALRSIVLSW